MNSLPAERLTKEFATTGMGYNAGMQEQGRLVPDTDRLGLLTATVLLTFAVTRVLPAPEYTVTLQIPGFYFAIPLTLETAITMLAGALTASGMSWLMRDHPSLHGKQNIEHWLLPTITTLALGASLERAEIRSRHNPAMAEHPPND